MKKAFFFLSISLVAIGCNVNSYELAIKNVKIFDGRTKNVLKNKTILINSDTIAAIVESGVKYKAFKAIEGNNRLITSGFIDTHIHLTDMYGDYEQAPEYLEKDSLSSYLDKMAKTYLLYGTTTIADMGQPEKWLPVTTDWQKNTSTHYPNLYNTGSAIISDEERIPYICHVEVTNPEEAKRKIAVYDSLGLSHLKLYWRLRAPEMEAIIEEATKRNISMYGHIDQNIVSIQKAIELGVRNFEHFLTLPASVIDYSVHYDSLLYKYQIEPPKNVDDYLALLVVYFDYINDDIELRNKLYSLLEKMAKSGSSLSTTIHILGALAEKTFFFTSMTANGNDEKSELNYSENQKKQLQKAYTTMMKFLKEAHDMGVKIRIGTDCRNGGKALLSELLLLNEAGIPIEDVLQIATLNGSEALKIDNQYGTVEIGKKADLVIFHQNPFDNYRNFLAEKTIIKAGKEVDNKLYNK